MEEKLSIGAVAIIIVIVLLLIYSQKQTNYSSNRISKLVNVTGGGFVESAKYYEGELKFVDTKNNGEYSIFLCTKDWSWIKEGYCYKLNLSEIEENVNNHKYSMELSGCYVGILQQVACD